MSDKKFMWDDLYQICINCVKCELANTRTNVVFGVGNRTADLMFIGEGPGEQEDLQAEPFVGASGQLLNRMLNAIELTRQDIYIANIIKCRPPNNRDPVDQEKQNCIGYLEEQINLIDPKMIVCLGRVAAQALIKKEFKITKEHGVWFDYKGRDIIATFHPSALLRDISKKKPAWEDFKIIKRKLK